MHITGPRVYIALRNVMYVCSNCLMSYLLLISLFLFTFCIHCGAGMNYTTASNKRQKFEENFQHRCSKYPFVDKFHNMLRRPYSDFLIFVYHEPGQGGNGGLGDRLAGIITALAFALRSNRTFLIVGDESFEKAFAPYFKTDDFSSASVQPSWANW